jgi:hypothetical protein
MEVIARRLPGVEKRTLWITFWGVIPTIFVPSAILWWITAEQKGSNLSRWPALLLALVGVAGLCCMLAAILGVWPREGLGSESPEDARTAKNPADRSTSAGELAANAVAARGEDVATDAKATDRARANVVQEDARTTEIPVDNRGSGVSVEHEQSTRRARWPLIAGIGVTATICLATVLVLASGSGRVHAATFRGGDLALSPAGNWHPKTVALAGLHIESPISIATADSYVLGGAIKDPRPIATDLPLSLSRAYGAPQHASVQTLPFGLAKQYTWSATNRHLPLVVFIASTTAGQMAIACQSRGASSVARIDALCTQFAASARFAGAKVEYPGPDPKVQAALSTALTPLTRAASKTADATHAFSLAVRARAFATVATADFVAAKSLQAAALPPLYEPLGTQLTVTLRAQRAMALQLAVAAKRGDRQAYESLRASSQAVSAPLSDTWTRAKSEGFALPGSPPLVDVPVLSKQVQTDEPATEPKSKSRSEREPKPISESRSEPEPQPKPPPKEKAEETFTTPER